MLMYPRHYSLGLELDMFSMILVHVILANNYNCYYHIINEYLYIFISWIILS